MSLTPVTAVATSLGVLTVAAGVVWLRAPQQAHDLTVASLGGHRRDEETVRWGSLPRGLVLLVLGVLCLLFAVLSA